MTSAKGPNPVLRGVVDWQARRIDDPVARLRFLRRTVGDLRPFGEPEAAPKEWWRRKRVRAAGLALLVVLPATQFTETGRFWRRPHAMTVSAKTPPGAKVWMVQQSKDAEMFSNGLRVERRFETSNLPRDYEVFRRGEEDSAPPEVRKDPAGIVFHTTESLQEAFEENNNRRLVYIGEALLGYIKRTQSYNYVIDRFGRVWRVVRDSDAAFHAGISVWADDRYTYVGLNHSFLGVALEAQTREEQGQAVEEVRATPAQINSLRLLTEMLRAHYSIDAANCVTHAQVSVNPSNKMIGYHTDWAAHFPYSEIGLPDNYATPNPALVLFGFSYDPELVHVTGERYWKGLLLGEEQLRQDATAHGRQVTAWRKQLQGRYKNVIQSLKQRSDESKEKQG